MTALYKDDVAGLNAMYDLVYPSGPPPFIEGYELKSGLIVKGLTSDGKYCGMESSKCVCTNAKRANANGGISNSCVLFKNNDTIEFGPSKDACTAAECKRRYGKSIEKFCGQEVLTKENCN
jgi:hypothetical protein